MAHKGILLYSGGLDSLLAAKILMEQGLELTGFHCLLPFHPMDFDPEKTKAARLAAEIGLKLVYHKCGKEYLDMVRNPVHGHGKHINPCIDCKIYFIKKAAEYMRETGAEFVATGEVVGQRPMSQLKHTINHIANITGLEGRLLRPLSAKLLKPTAVEENGTVDRNRLLDINGRGRYRQMELAAHYGIREYESPAGGCLMTDENISRRMKALFDMQPESTPDDSFLLTVGRHFKLDETSKLIVSRNQQETEELNKYRPSATLFFEPEFKGPSAIITGNPSQDYVDFASSAVFRYGKPESSDDVILVYKKGTLYKSVRVSAPADDETLSRMRI